jgi:ABC-type Na+ efflux pump permease subunit
MSKLWNYLFNYRLRALIKKELAQTRHDRKLMFSLTVLPVVQLTLVGFALSAAVSNVRLAIVDDSRSPESRELIATLTESKSFRLAGYYSSVDQLGDAVSQGKADAGMVVPYDYARDLAPGSPDHSSIPAERHECKYGDDQSRLCRKHDSEIQHRAAESGDSCPHPAN